MTLAETIAQLRAMRDEQADARRDAITMGRGAGMAPAYNRRIDTLDSALRMLEAMQRQCADDGRCVHGDENCVCIFASDALRTACDHWRKPGE